MPFDLKPIRNERDHAAALAELRVLFDAKPGPGSADFDRFEMLAMLVEAYELETHPIAPPDPVAALEFYMDQHGLRAKDFGELIGSKARASEILNRKRSLSIGQVRTVHRAWNIPADTLIQEVA